MSIYWQGTECLWKYDASEMLLDEQAMENSVSISNTPIWPPDLMWKYNALAIVNEQAMEGIQKSTLVNPISVSGPPPKWPEYLVWMDNAFAIVNEQALEKSQECL